MSKDLILQQNIKSKIYTIRGQQVMLDRDLAELFEVKTSRLNEQVKRNKKRFPAYYMFQLTKDEKDMVVAICDNPESIKFSPRAPYVFTEHGVSQLASVLNSDIAINMGIKIIDIFVAMRRFLESYGHVFKKLSTGAKLSRGLSSIGVCPVFSNITNVLFGKSS